MARPGQRKPEVGKRLSDHIALGVLTKTFPGDVVDRAIDESGRREQRVRQLPARVVVYFTLAMCLFAQESYNEVMTLLTKGLQWSNKWSSSWKLPTDTAIAFARQRLGPEPMKVLFASVVKPIATKKTKGAWYRDWRLVAIDGTVLDVCDTPENDKYFSRPGSKGEDRAAFPQARVMGLIECGTHVIFDAVIGPCSDSENKLTPGLFSSVKARMLLLCDRGFWGYELWKQAATTGADLLWRTKSNVVLPVSTFAIKRQHFRRPAA